MPRKRQRVSFKATKVVKQPATIKFITKDGKSVSFKATRLVRKPTRVSFTAKSKKRK